MDQIEHKFIEANGVKIHVAEVGSGSGPVVVFLHGFPEIWYSWRHQMIGVAKAGFRAIAIDYRGYGLSDQPPEPEKTTYLDLVNDLVALLDALSIKKVFVIGKDFGVFVLSYFCLLHEESVSGFVTLGMPLAAGSGIVQNINLPEGFYVSRWKEPGSELPIAHENQEIMDIVEPSTPLPPWFTEVDLETYGALYEKSGFRTALKVPYRSFGEQIDLPADPKVEVPGLFIMGEKDYALKVPGMEEYTRSGMLKAVVPKLETVFIAQGSHFVQEQLADEVNQLILSFLTAHSSA